MVVVSLRSEYTTAKFLRITIVDRLPERLCQLSDSVQKRHPLFSIQGAYHCLGLHCAALRFPRW